MTFEIKIELNQKWYRMNVEQVHASESLERFKVTGGNRSILLETNRPESKKRKRKPKWKILSGDIQRNNLEEAALAMLRIFDAIEKHFSPVEERNVHQRRKD